MVDLAARSTVEDDETSSLPAIEVDNVSASYRLRLDNESLWADVRGLVSRRRTNDRLVPALRDISFSVDRGSVLAVIGRNGAGKSTLLRTIAGILAPEAGRIVVRGEMCLFTLGLGMNEALTGRENIKLGGLAIGLPIERIAALTDEIAEFAQLDEYIDYPIRIYSAGMRARLGFAVSSHLDPEILLIDEALAGGDAAFLAHAGERLAQLCGEGRTIVLVTHGLSSVKRMATSAIWLHQGKVVESGDPDDVVARYMRYCRLESMPLDLDDQ